MLLLNFLHIRLFAPTAFVSETRTFPLYSDGRYAHCSEIVLKIYDSCLIQLPYNSNLIHEWSRLERWYYVPSHTDILTGLKEYLCNIVISNRPPYAYAFSAVNILQKPFNISRYILTHTYVLTYSRVLCQSTSGGILEKAPTITATTNPNTARTNDRSSK